MVNLYALGRNSSGCLIVVTMLKMATIIQIKKRFTNFSTSTLKQGELALTFGTGSSIFSANLGDRLFIGTGSVDGNGDATSIDIIGGKYFADLNDANIYNSKSTIILLIINQ